ncbi:AMP-binding protein [Pseudoteredinibacter isoporae]|uniref:Long-chain acyl-CoA synthetase n=1 Tax=Pseudoteredinibacter isoporae TaxID=570281 RepID=A0A7X0JUY8_9GAMM|nr:AMP-binding protein [Pseudoteredinibacter isoporae]MBB6522203.1 long-chain acyl-CoA synthetase [Pseudoteredinibacter isoporae]NHO87737.1 AMP-binding protein [Pseudoteredinibacter isoporae]NIB23932.1 AMP-binding protein [Pseudoteredinibacter isoporae]
MPSQIVFAGQALSETSFLSGVKKIASVLVANGVRPDDAIAILMRNEPMYLQIIEACRYVGARYVALNWHGSAAEIAHILEDSKAKVLLGHRDLLNVLSEHTVFREQIAGIAVLAQATPRSIIERYELGTVTEEGGYQNLHAAIEAAEEIASAPQKVRGLFAYTSGSTGRPKGIVRPSHPDAPDRYMMYQMLAQGFMFLQPGDKFYMAAPMYHSAPNTLSLSALSATDVDIYIESQFDPEDFLKIVEREKITHAYIVPTMMIRLLKLPQEVREQYDVCSLRYSVSTGSPCPVDVKQAMIDWFGPIFYESYGASELGFMTLISATEALEKPGSVGRAREGTAIKILNDELQELGPGETGTIYIHSMLASGFGYTNSEGDLTDQELGGFATVGDVGYLDDEGFLFISDRKKEMIISGGANIFPSEIEAEILRLPQVLDCAVFGAPDEEFGEKIVAAVQLQDGQVLSLGELQHALEGQLARFKMPRKLDVHEALPREDSGKIFKKRLKDPYWEGAGRQI